MSKEDLTLDNLERDICHKTKSNRNSHISQHVKLLPSVTRISGNRELGTQNNILRTGLNG